MDQIKTGKFIAACRKNIHLTQEQLGEKIGVTNKTVSRWENGNYMPDISAIQSLAQLFGVSISDIIAGEQLTDQKLRECSDEIIVDAAKNELFSFRDKQNFWKKKWRREHRLSIVIQIAVALVIYAVIWFLKKEWLPIACGVFPIICIILYAISRNRMMIYVEKKLYD